MTNAVAQLWNLPEDERPTAIMTANDWMGRGLYTAVAAVARVATLRLLDQIESPGNKVDAAIQLVHGRLVERSSVRALADVQYSGNAERQPLPI